MRRRWDCMLLAADCAADEKPGVFVLGVGADVGKSCGSNRTRPGPIKLLRFLHAVHRHHLATIHVRTPQCAEIMPILPWRTPMASDDHPLLEVVDNHRPMCETNGAQVR